MVIKIAKVLMSVFKVMASRDKFMVTQAAGNNTFIFTHPDSPSILGVVESVEHPDYGGNCTYATAIKITICDSRVKSKESIYGYPIFKDNIISLFNESKPEPKVYKKLMQSYIQNIKPYQLYAEVMDPRDRRKIYGYMLKDLYGNVSNTPISKDIVIQYARNKQITGVYATHRAENNTWLIGFKPGVHDAMITEFRERHNFM